MNEKLLPEDVGKSLTERMGIDQQQQAEWCAFLHLEERDGALLRQLAPVIERHADRIVDGFYANVQRYKALEEVIFKAGSTIDRLKQAQRAYLLELFSGSYGEEYFERRLRIGVVHHQIGLTPRWYLGSYTVYMELISPVILRHWWHHPLRAVRAIRALNKVLSLDSQLAIETYIHGLMSELRSTMLSKDDMEQRIDRYQQLVERVGRGDLTARLAIQDDDEMAALDRSLNQMVVNLSDITNKVTESSNGMLVTAEQVNAAVGAQSTGAAQQASAINETTTTLQQIKATSQQTLEKAASLLEVAERTKSEGSEGLQAVETAIESMQDIRKGMEDISTHIAELNERLQQIGDITTTVSELAQQSKMLALNASIEAAKAGDAGRGFAVVAEEVKDMAEQSRLATTQVQQILDEVRAASNRAVSSVESGNQSAIRGSDLAERAGKTLSGLNKVIHDTARGNQQIVAAVRQEAAGIEQIRYAMEEINKVTSQFVSATRQTESAADQLIDYATELQAMVHHFKVEKGEFDFEQARETHRTWLHRMEAFLAGSAKIDVEEAITHHHCALGRWYDGEGASRFGSMPELQQLAAPHRAMHNLIIRVVNEVHQGREVDHGTVMSELRTLSAEVIRLLTVIEKKSRSEMASGQEQ